jgi:tRNA nucleotidyltransferase/poly(A) polymerase
MIKKFFDKLLNKARGTKAAPPLTWCTRSSRPGSRPTSSAARCATCCWACAPKDFDVATNATPEQVKGLFRRAFIIGRRFRIVHVVFGRGREHEVIEVSTFRAYMDNAAAEQVAGNEKTSKQRAGRHEACRGCQRPGAARQRLGPAGEDAARRDFTSTPCTTTPRRRWSWTTTRASATAKAQCCA